MSRKVLVLDTLIMAAGVAAVLATVPAQARERCTDAPKSEWKAVHEVSAHAAQLGYTVTKVERDGTCYEVKGYDRNGARIELYYNPQTGEPVTRK